MTSTPEQLRADEELRRAGGETLEKRFAQLVHSESAKGSARPVSNLGDAALWAERAGQLWILQQDRALVTVSFHGDSAQDAFARCRAVAEKILPRL